METRRFKTTGKTRNLILKGFLYSNPVIIDTVRYAAHIRFMDYKKEMKKMRRNREKFNLRVVY